MPSEQHLYPTLVLISCVFAQYAHQQEVDMVPLLMQAEYRPKGWLGLILGCVLARSW